MANETYKFSLNAEYIDKKLNTIPDSCGGGYKSYYICA